MLVQRCTFAALLCLSGAPVWAAGKLDYGSRVGMEVTILSMSGIDSAHAEIHVKHTAADAKKFCVEYSQDRSRACVERTLRDTRLNDVLIGNCTTGEYTSLYGDRLRFAGENKRRQDGAPKYRILGTDGPLDGTSASGYGYNLSQFEALCPSKAFGSE